MRPLHCLLLLLLLPSCAAELADGDTDEKSDSLGDLEEAGDLDIVARSERVICHPSITEQDDCTDIADADSLVITTLVEKTDSGHRVTTEDLIFRWPHGKDLRVSSVKADIAGEFDISNPAMDAELIAANAVYDLSDTDTDNAEKQYVYSASVSPGDNEVSRVLTMGRVCDRQHSPDSREWEDCRQDRMSPPPLSIPGLSEGDYELRVTPLPYENAGRFDLSEYEITVKFR